MNHTRVHNREVSSSTPIQQGKFKKFGYNERVSPIELSSSTGETELAKMKKTTVLGMVIEAITAVGEKRKGASYQTIKKWITVNKEVDTVRLKFLLKMALKKGIDRGILVRPSKSASTVGALGFFMLAKTKPLKSSKMVVKKPANKMSANEVGKISANKAKSSPQDTKTLKKLYNPEIGVKPQKTSSKDKATNKKATAKVVKTLPKKVEKKTAKRAAATKKPAAVVPPKPGAENSTKKAPLKARVEKKAATRATATKKTAAKVSLKAAVKKNVKKAPLKVRAQKKSEKAAAATKKPVLDVPLKTEPEEVAEKVPSNAKVGKNTSNKGISKVKASKLIDENIHRKNNSNELERQELSDTEVTIKNNHIRISFLSDTELEISKKEEKRPKRTFKKSPIRARKLLPRVKNLH